MFTLAYFAVTHHYYLILLTRPLCGECFYFIIVASCCCSFGLKNIIVIPYNFFSIRNMRMLLEITIVIRNRYFSGVQLGQAFTILPNNDVLVKNWAVCE